MDEKRNAHTMTKSSSDDAVFTRLSIVEKEYERYLKLAQIGSVLIANDPPPVPPSPDPHLTLTIGDDNS